MAAIRRSHRYSSIVSRTLSTIHGRIVVARKRRRALESGRSRYADAKPSLERVSGNPRFVRPHGVPAASDHGRLNALTASGGKAIDVEDRERHLGHCSGE